MQPGAINLRDHCHRPRQPTQRAEFDHCEVTAGPGTTTLRAELPGQAALIELPLWITALRFELIDMRRVEPPPGGG